MLVHLRRSVILAVIALVLTFVYAFVGTGVSQVLFKHQADGSITANGSTLIGQNWSATKCPGHPLGSCVFQGRPDDLGPYAANPKATPAVPAGTTPWWPTATQRRSRAAHQPGPPLQDAARATPRRWSPTGTGGASTPPRTWSPPRAAGTTPTSRAADATAQIPMVSRATGLSASALRALITRQNQRRAAGLPRQQLHRRPAAQRSAGPTAAVTITAMSAVVPRVRTTVAGRIIAVRAYRRPWMRLDVELGDGTGTLILRFTGRAAIPGMSRGRRVGAEGMPSAQGGRLFMLNPHYAFVVDDGVVDDVVVDHDHAEQSSDDEGGSIHSIERERW